MKGLKTLGAMLLSVALLTAATTATAGAAAFKHYVACGVSQNATPAHKCPKQAKKGAFFKSLQGDVNYSVCVKFPTGKNICAKAQPEATQGHAVRQQADLESSPASTESPGSSKANASAPSSSRSLAELGAQEKAVVGFDTATADTAVCAARAGEVLHESLLGPSAEDEARGTRPCCSLRWRVRRR